MIPLRILAALDTQWNHGFKGRIGIRYEAVPVVFEEFGIKKKQRAEMMKLLRIMERAAIEEINRG